MQEEIKKKIIADICKEFKDIIFAETEENEKALPYLCACVNFICELEQKGIKASFNSFCQDVKAKVYEELKQQF